MPYFFVLVKEIYEQAYAVEADSEEEARQAVADNWGVLVEGHFDYTATLDPESWNTEEDQEAKKYLEAGD